MGDRFEYVGSGAGCAPAVGVGSPAPEATGPDPLGAVDAAFDRVDAALDTLMGALAAVESTPAGALAWSADRARGLASRAAVVTNRAARVRSRVVSVVGAARQDGGLHHLADRGVETVELYVDGDNPAAIATYHRLGFERSAIDVMYAAGGASS